MNTIQSLKNINFSNFLDFNQIKEKKAIIKILESPEKRIKKYLSIFQELNKEVYNDKDIKKCLILFQEKVDFLNITYNSPKKGEEKGLTGVFDFMTQSPKKATSFIQGIMGDFENLSNETFGYLNAYTSGMKKEVKSIYSEVVNNLKLNNESPFINLI